MKKKLLAIIALLCVAAFVLSACGGGENAGGSSKTNGKGAAETYDVGTFTVSVPSGWSAFPVEDRAESKDADGNYPIDPETIFLAKGAKTEFDAYSSPNIRIYWYSTNTYVLDTSSFYDNVKEISDVTINGVECKAYSGESGDYEYQFIHYDTEDAQYEFNILTAYKGEKTGVTWKDEDIKTIMESVATK